jgi:hypothetical protein
MDAKKNPHTTWMNHPAEHGIHFRYYYGRQPHTGLKHFMAVLPAHQKTTRFPSEKGTGM